MTMVLLDVLACHVDLNFDRLPNYVSKGAKADLGDEYSGALQKEIARLNATK
jgi:hypothetical protein